MNDEVNMLGGKLTIEKKTGRGASNAGSQFGTHVGDRRKSGTFILRHSTYFFRV